MTDPPPVLSAEERLESLLHFPQQLLLETTSHCNLNCSMCARQFNPRKWGNMDEALARKVLDEVTSRAPDCRVWFCYFGEPLIRKRAGLFDRIRYAKDKGLRRAAINTNANLMDERCVRDMLAAGLDEVYVGLDAATPQTYSKVRIGGDYNRVVDNVHRLVKLAGGRIKVTVQYGVYENNDHEVEAFKEYWAKYPVHIFVRPKLTWCGQLDDIIKSPAPRHACAWIFDSINVNEDGRVPYCITDWQNQLPMGDVRHESIFDIWRKKVIPNLIIHAKQDWANLPEFCKKCPDWQTKPPRDNELLDLLAKLPVQP